MQFNTKRVVSCTWLRSYSGGYYVAVCNLMSFSLKDFVKVKCDVDVKPLKNSGHYIYHQIQQFYVVLMQCIYVFYMDMRTNSDYFPIQH
jgi:hypothetical protein